MGALSQLPKILFAEFPGIAAIQNKVSEEGEGKRGRVCVVCVFYLLAEIL